MITNITRDTPTIYNDTVYQTSLMARWAYYLDLIGCPAKPFAPDGVAVEFRQGEAGDRITIRVGAHSGDFERDTPTGVLILAHGLPGPRPNETYKDGGKCCDTCFSWYGYIFKRWADPYWGDDVSWCEKSPFAASLAADARVVSGILVPFDGPRPLPNQVG